MKRSLPSRCTEIRNRSRRSLGYGGKLYRLEVAEAEIRADEGNNCHEQQQQYRKNCFSGAHSCLMWLASSIPGRGEKHLLNKILKSQWIKHHYSSPLSHSLQRWQFWGHPIRSGTDNFFFHEISGTWKWKVKATLPEKVRLGFTQKTEFQNCHHNKVL